jgi:hypothetical protein
MKKNANQKQHARLRSLDAAQLAAVTGGASQQVTDAAIQLVGLACDNPGGSAWAVFFGSAASAALQG